MLSYWKLVNFVTTIKRLALSGSKTKKIGNADLSFWSLEVKKKKKEQKEIILKVSKKKHLMAATNAVDEGEETGQLLGKSNDRSITSSYLP